MEHLLPDEPSIQTLIKVPESEKKKKHIWVTYLHNNVAAEYETAEVWC